MRMGWLKQLTHLLMRSRDNWQKVGKERLRGLQDHVIWRTSSYLIPGNLDEKRSSAAWNMTLLDQLHTGLHQQLEYLETCLVKVMVEEEFAGVFGSPTLGLRKVLPGNLCLPEIEEIW
nr:interferon alpha-1-like [Macaca nemestrina]XP_024653938.1 interferon alpha-1-like [Macaca nemestrina]